MNNIENALSRLEEIVKESGNESDLTYFMFHRVRFRKMAETITGICRPGGLVLDIGSHYLHSSLLLSFLGYKVISMDVGEFWGLDYIKERAEKNGLTPVIENNLEKMAAVSGQKDVYDLILFTEIFEHITFNPIGFWKRIHTIIKDKGIIYITTPNALTIYGMLKTLVNLVKFKGIGIDVNAIFATVTYGHHWKEYSTKEIREYFRKMNDGFKVTMRKFYYKSFVSDSFKSWFRVMLINTGNRIPYFRDGIEAVVTVDKSYDWKINTPVY